MFQQLIPIGRNGNMLKQDVSAQISRFVSHVHSQAADAEFTVGG